MEWRKFIVLITALGIAVLSIASVWVYALLGAEAKMVWLFYLIVVSAWTSFFGVLWALYSVWKFHKVIDETRAEIDAKLKGHFSPFYELYVRLRDRYDSLPEEKRRIMASKIERMIDSLIERMTKE
jgi:hypothetical protein